MRHLQDIKTKYDLETQLLRPTKAVQRHIDIMTATACAYLSLEKNVLDVQASSNISTWCDQPILKVRIRNAGYVYPKLDILLNLPDTYITYDGQSLAAEYSIEKVFLDIPAIICIQVDCKHRLGEDEIQLLKNLGRLTEETETTTRIVSHC